MQPETWQTAGQIAVLIGFILTGLGGFYTYHYGKVSDRIKEKQAQDREVQWVQKIDGLDQGNKILQEKLKPFEQLANTKYPNMENDAALGQLYREFQQFRQKMEDGLNDVSEKAKPNTIARFSEKIERTKSGLKAIIKFKPLKNQPLGQLRFIVDLPKDSTEKILNFWPNLEGGAFQSGEDSKKITPDGHAAQLIYSLMGPGGYPTIELEVSGSTPVRIKGNNGLDAFELNIVDPGV